MSIEIASVSLSLNDKNILRDVSLEIKPGEILSIIGPNGAGKTTLLNVITGNSSTNNGEVFYNSKALKTISIQERAYIRSVMSQFQNIAFDYSVSDIIQMGWLDHRFNMINDHLENYQHQIIEECDLKSLINQKFNTLSGGEQRRVHFARTLLQLWQPPNANDQNYLLLDEPFSNLDMVHKLSMMHSIKKRAATGTGILMILHDLNLAYSFSDRIIILKNGAIVKEGCIKEMLNEDLLSMAYGTKIMIHQDPINIRYY